MKHGWIERDKSFRDTTKDDSVRWGSPFDDGHDNNSEDGGTMTMAPGTIVDREVAVAAANGDVASKAEAESSSSFASLADLRAVADRACTFLNAEGKVLGEIKGFDESLVMRSYGLAKRQGEKEDSAGPKSGDEGGDKEEGAGPSADGPGLWYVDEAALDIVFRGRQNDPEVREEEGGGITLRLDLPLRKDLLKRVKTVLSRCSGILTVTASAAAVALSTSPLGKVEGGSSSAAAKGEDDGNSMKLVGKHNFCTLDLDDGRNVLLAELLRGVIKVSLGKGTGQKMCRKLLQYATKEVERRLEDGKGSRDGDGKVISPVPVPTPVLPPAPAPAPDMNMDMTRIREHLRLVSRTMKLSSHRQAKNVLRAILGVEPIQPKNPKDDLFPVDRLIPFAAAKSKGGAKAQASAVEDGLQHKREYKRAQQKQKEAAAGDVAINRALAVGLKKRITVREGSSSSSSSSSAVLKLTSIETLLLSVICSQGIPVWKEDWEVLVDPQCCIKQTVCSGEEYVISWYRMGEVILNAATVWQDIASKNLQRKLAHLDGRRADLTEGQVRELSSECKQLQSDVDRKLQAISDAKQLSLDPHQLARKSVMMLEKLRCLMGPVDSGRGGGGGAKKIRTIKRSENGLGPRVLLWCGRELCRWASSLSLLDESGRCISSTASEYMEDQGLPDANLAAFFDRKACRTIFAQVAQQTRLRSIFTKSGVDDMRLMLPKALRNSQNNGDVWDRRPEWWCVKEDGLLPPSQDDSDPYQDDMDLLCGILDFGYSGFDEIVKENPSFQRRINETTTTTSVEKRKEGGLGSQSHLFIKASVQQRLNHVTRELSALDDTADVMRIVSERVHRGAGDAAPSVDEQKPKYPEDADSITKRSSLGGGGGGVQTGIDAFFRSSQTGGPGGATSSRVSDEDSDGCSVEVIRMIGNEASRTAEKRKTDDVEALDLALSSKKSKVE